MKFKVEHTTLFEYDAPVYETATELRLRPADGPGDRQRCLEFHVTVEPTAPVFSYLDYYGNTVHHFNLLRSHNRLVITAKSLVETGYSGLSADWNEILFEDFLHPSAFVKQDSTVRDFASRFARTDDPAKVADEISREIQRSFIYETGVTDVSSTSAEVMKLGRGVCQDFAHVMIAACRDLGIPAKYISGYLYGGPGSEDFARASHAWCEVYCGPERGWIGFDPTHEETTIDQRYIKIGTGRDYGDVTLVRGTFKGQAVENLKATVRVTALNP